MTIRKITIGGKERPILFKLRAIKIYQQLTGKNLLKEDLSKLFTDNLDAGSICALVYSVLVCGCYPNKAEFTPEDIENWLGLDTDIFKEVIQAYLDFIPGARTINLEEPDPNVKSQAEVA
jgi:hypothetical protein